MPLRHSALFSTDFHMNFLVGAIAGLFVFILIQGCTGKEESTGGGKNQEEAAIEKKLIDLADANTQFPHTKDSQSVLRFYSQDYAGIDNGNAESLKDIEKYLSDVLERMNLGEPLGISSKVTNIKTSVTGPLGWATYEFEWKLGRGGVVLQTNQGQCSTIFRKQGDSWLIRHEHCSTANPFAR
jgi:ketosteroid isomerase-like protein